MIKTHTCKNGLRVVLESVPSVRSVTIGIWILTGSRYETAKNNGISHFLEHMLFKGTKTRTARQIAEAFDSIGGQVNAFTSKEYTCFYARVLDSYKEHALEVLTDMLFHSTFLTEELEREKKVVMEEIKMYEDTPDDHVHDLLAKASFGEHPLGRPIIGTDKQIKTFTKQALIDYMDTFYIPQNIVISVAGNVHSDFIQTIEDFFTTLPVSNKTISKEAPTFQANTLIKNKETEQAHLCVAYPGLAISDSSIPALLLVNSVLGGGMSSRLFQEIREKQGLAYSVYSYHASYLDSGLLTIYAGTNKEQLDILQSAIEQTVTTLGENGLTEAELTNRKEQLKGNMMLSLESTNSKMSRNGKNVLLLNRQRTLDDIICEIDAVDEEAIYEVMKRTLLQKPAQAMILP